MSTETLNISYSRLNTYRACPQKYNYSYIRNLQADRSAQHPVELNFGNWWHALRAIDSIARGITHKSLRYVPEKLHTVEGISGNPDAYAIELPTLEELYAGYPIENLSERFDSALRKWESTLDDEDLAAWEDRLGATPVARLEYVAGRYMEAYPDDVKYHAPIAVELPFSRGLPSVGGVSPYTILHGYVDEVYKDTRRNVLVVRDYKTHKSLENRSATDDLMDSQLHMYTWGISQWLREQELPLPTLVEYDRARSVAPKQPKLTLTGTLSKSVTDYDYHTYLEFSKGVDGQGVPFQGRKKDGSQAGVYTAEDTVLKSLSAPVAREKWFTRAVHPVNANIVKAHLRAAVTSAFGIREVVSRAEVIREAGRNVSSLCKWCYFAQLCRAEMIGGSEGTYDLKDMGLVERSPNRR